MNQEEQSAERVSFTFRESTRLRELMQLYLHKLM